LPPGRALGEEWAVQLPNYFLADQPPESVLRPGMVVEACQTLRRNRERFLLPRSTEALVQTILEVARAWLHPHSPWRSAALAQGPATTGLSPEVLAAGLDAWFRSLTARNLNALIVQDLGHPQRLDRLVSNDSESVLGAQALARGPELLAHITAGVLPTPVFTALIHGLIVRSAQFVKCATGTSLLPRLFAHSLRDIEPKLAACVEVAEWKGGTADLEAALFAEADCVVAAGSDETMERIRQAVPPRGCGSWPTATA
jgi:hypothetical protein